MATITTEPVYWTRLIYGDWSLYIAATSEGLCFVGSEGGPLQELLGWKEARLPDRPLQQDDRQLESYKMELLEYIRGERESFAIPFDLRGTPFQLAVWQTLRTLPFGRTRTYSEIAEQIGRPAAVRAVGAAIGANPVLIAVPCHRVIGRNGALTGYRGGLAMKAKLLRLESGGRIEEGGLRHA